MQFSTKDFSPIVLKISKNHVRFMPFGEHNGILWRCHQSRRFYSYTFCEYTLLYAIVHQNVMLAIRIYIIIQDTNKRKSKCWKKEVLATDIENGKPRQTCEPYRWLNLQRIMQSFQDFHYLTTAFFQVLLSLEFQ